MFRSHDWQCSICERVQWALIWVSSGCDAQRHLISDCPTCERATEHRQIISLTAEYHGERVLNPIVHGGSYDTAGTRELPTMDALPSLPKDASKDARKDQIEAYRQRFSSPEWKDLKSQQASIQKDNVGKRQRLQAINNGENINMRRDKLPGDPKVTA